MYKRQFLVGAVGGIVFTMLASLIVESYGLKTTWIVIGLLVLIVAVAPPLLLVAERPEDIGLNPDGEIPRFGDSEELIDSADSEPLTSAPNDESWSLGEAVHTGTFWIMVVMGFTMYFVHTSIGVHMGAYFRDVGLGPTSTALAISLSWIVSAIGSVGWGVVTDRVPIRYAYSLMFLIQAGSTLYLMMVGDTVGIFLAAALFGVVTALEKRLIDHHLPNLGVYYASIAYSLLLPAAIVFLATGGIPDEATNLNMGWAALSGGTWGVGLAMVFWGYKLEEASRASAIVHTFPVFVAILAVFTLGESLIPGQWAAIFVIVAGAFIISIRRSGKPGISSFSRAFPILIIASLLTALSHIFAKAALDQGLTVWMTYAIRAAAMAVAFSVLAKPRGFFQMLAVLRNWRTLALMLAADFVMAPMASISLTRATELGACLLYTSPSPRD